MLDYPKFLNIRYSIWWNIFCIIQASLIIIMGSTFGASIWVYSDNEVTLYYNQWYDESDNVYNGKKFEGNLKFCKEGCDKSYRKLAAQWCGYYDELKDNQEDFSEDDSIFDQYLSVCKMYSNLVLGSDVYIALEALSMICIVFWAFGMYFWSEEINCLRMTYCCSGCMWTCHYIALIAYLGLTRSNFNGDCDSFPTNGERPKLCAGSGPALSLFILLIIPFISILYYVVACRLHNCFYPGDFVKIARRVNTVHQVAVNPPALYLDQAGNYPIAYDQAPGGYPAQFNPPYAPGPNIYNTQANPYPPPPVP